MRNQMVNDSKRHNTAASRKKKSTECPWKWNEMSNSKMERALAERIDSILTEIPSNAFTGEKTLACTSTTPRSLTASTRHPIQLFKSGERDWKNWFENERNVILFWRCDCSSLRRPLRMMWKCEKLIFRLIWCLSIIATFQHNRKRCYPNVSLWQIIERRLRQKRAARNKKKFDLFLTEIN